MDKIATKEALSAVAQALNDKIAQQDYIRIPVAGESFETDFSDAEKAEISKYVKAGLAYDIILFAGDIEDPAEEISTRVIAVSTTGDRVFIYNPQKNTIEAIEFV